MNEVERYEQLMQNPNAVFVFGSNLAGRHGAGAAKTAKERYGAYYGVGAGPQGRSYAIPTKDQALKTRPLSEIERSVEVFLAYARLCSDKRFIVTRIGCGLAGYTDEEIAPFFAHAPNNVVLPERWQTLRTQQTSERFATALGEFTQRQIVRDMAAAFVEGIRVNEPYVRVSDIQTGWVRSKTYQLLLRWFGADVVDAVLADYWIALDREPEPSDDDLPFG